MTQPLGRYHLGDTLGGGPTGEVFRAKVYGVAGFERQFAVKRVHQAMATDRTASEILASAARAYGSVEHPRVARMHEFGTTGGVTFIAVELVQGLDVARLLAGTAQIGEPLPLGASVGLLAQAARAIGFAHQRGVLHLGICPTNVLVTPEGDVKVCDFGFLRARLRGDPAADVTLAARLPYLAPEQLAGREQTAATDVFQLATLGYELVTGERAFTGRTTAEIAHRIAEVLPPDPKAPPALCEVLRRAFAASPADRFASAGAFADALEAAIRQSPLPGGRSDAAAAVRRTTMRSQDMSAQAYSGAVTFPLPAPPPSVPGVPLSSVFPDGKVPRRLESPTPQKITPATTLRIQQQPVVPPARPAEESMLRTPVGDTVRVEKAEPEDEGEVLEIEALPEGFTDDVTVDLSSSEEYPPKEWPDTIDQRPTTRTPPPIPAPPPRGPTPPPARPPAVQTTMAISVAPPPLRPPPRPGNGQTTPPPPAPPTTMPPGVMPMPPPGAPRPKPPVKIEPTKDARPDQPPTMRTRTTPQFAGVAPPEGRKGGMGKWLVALVLLGGVGGGGYWAYGRYLAPMLGTPAPKTPVAVATPDAGAAAAIDAGASDAAIDAPAIDAAIDAGAIDAAAVDAAPPDAAPPDAAPTVVALPPDAAVAVAEKPVRPTTPADGPLEITVTPRGAVVYLDGARKGTSPIELAGSGDRHKLVVMMRGHELHREDIAGAGKIEVTLQPIPRWTRGPAGIKVRCKSRDRLYVIIDGKHTGELCPSDRIPVPLGEHTVEIFDPVTDTTVTEKANIKDADHSHRIVVDN